MGAPSADGSKGFAIEGLAGVPDSAAVKTIKVVSKKKMAQAQGVSCGASTGDMVGRVDAGVSAHS